MSEERQRILREQGSQPAEAEKAERAQSSREELAREQAELEAQQGESGAQPAPEAEDDPSRPRPRR
jgi:hypothetical protein